MSTEPNLFYFYTSFQCFNLLSLFIKLKGLFVIYWLINYKLIPRIARIGLETMMRHACDYFAVSPSHALKYTNTTRHVFLHSFTLHFSVILYLFFYFYFQSRIIIFNSFLFVHFKLVIRIFFKSVDKAGSICFSWSYLFYFGNPII